MRKLAIVLCCCCVGQAQAQGLLLYEPFDYAVAEPILGQTITDGPTWLAAHQSATPPGNIKVGGGNLAMPTGLGAGVGNSADIDFSNSATAGNANNSGKAVRLPLDTSITSGTVYFSFALRVDEIFITDPLPFNGGFFIGLNNLADATTTNPGTVAARIQMHVDPADNAKYGMAVVRNRAVSGPTDIPASDWNDGMIVGQTHFIVASLEIVPGAQNDVARLWINPGDLGAETAPAPTVDDASTGIGTDFAQIAGATGIASIILRQSPTPSLTIDELRVGTTWASVTTAAAEPEGDADFDDDGDVDGNDFLIWQRGLTANEDGTNATGDANGDTNVDGDDLAIWKSDFGTATPNANPVPEPASLTLLALAAAAGLGRAAVVRRRGK